MNELGNINISSDVVAEIASSVVTSIDGVYSLAGSQAKNDLTKFFQNVTAPSQIKGVEVEVGETECAVDVYVIAKLGYQLPALAGDIQKQVMKSITDMTGLKVREVNVYIQKVVKDEPKVEEEKIEID